MRCEDFQVAIERELHGALPADECERLRAHLSTCEACRAYQGAAAGMERAMAAGASGAAREVDWERVERGIRRGLQDGVRMLAAAVLGAGLVMALAWFAVRPELRAERMGRAGVAVAVTVMLIAVVASYAARRLTGLARGPEMLAALRDRARARVRAGQWVPWLALGLGAWTGFRAFTASSARFDAPLLYGGATAILLAAGAVARFVKLPAARRELAELERDGLA